MNKNDYVAAVLWTKDDIACQMAEMGITPTEENIEEVINSGLLKKLNDCDEQDWNIIEYAITETLGTEQER